MEPLKDIKIYDYRNYGSKLIFSTLKIKYSKYVDIYIIKMCNKNGKTQ